MKRKKSSKIGERCSYIRSCYLAEELKCFGYRNDCPLYLQSNGQYCDEKLFNEAVDKLIIKARIKHEKPSG